VKTGNLIVILVLTGLCLFAGALIFVARSRAQFSQHATAETNNVPALLRSPLLREFRLTETDKGRSSIRYTLTARERVLKIEVIREVEKDTAEALLKDGIMGLEALYANALSPYPGDISNKVVADPRFRPEFVRRTSGQTTYSYYLLFANERLGYGAATADAVKFKSLLGWLYCEQSKEFYKVKYFVPLETKAQQVEALFLSLACR
jgi:hypothetical protein